MLELASLGAGVMHNRSIEFAKKYGVPIHVRSSFSDTMGTLIVSESESPSSVVCGAAMTRDEARITVQGVPDVPGTSLQVFQLLAENKIDVDMIVQNVGEERRADVSFTVLKQELKQALQVLGQAVQQVGATGCTYDDDVSKVSVVGLGMASQTGVAQRMFQAVADAGINIQMITTSEIKISILVSRGQAQAALRAVHQAFELHKTPADAVKWSTLPTRKGSQADLDKLVKDLHAADMEQLQLSDISMSDDQARITLSGVPDSPGLAANVFSHVAAAGVNVDMIVQSCDGYQGITSISFTIPRQQYQKCLQVVESFKKQFGVHTVTGSPQICKLSVSGIGLRSHTSVAIGMFQALANSGVNVDMINTSELRVNVVVDSGSAKQALASLTERFQQSIA
jgi:aspartate kinase